MTHTRTETREERFNRKLREALVAGRYIDEDAATRTRANSIALTELETAILWSAKDLAEKERG